MRIGNFILGLAPWFLFSVMTHRLGANEAAFAGLVAAVVALALMIYSRGKGGFKILDAAAVVTFGAIAVIGFAGGQPVDDWLSNFGRGGSTLILAGLMLVSAVTVPFTEQYARDSVPREYWGTPEFRAKNRTISLVWGAAVLVMGLGHLLAGFIDSTTDPAGGSRPTDLLLNWVVPIGLIVLAMKYTEHAAADAPDEEVRSS